MIQSLAGANGLLISPLEFQAQSHREILPSVWLVYVLAADRCQRSPTLVESEDHAKEISEEQSEQVHYREKDLVLIASAKGRQMPLDVVSSIGEIGRNHVLL